MKSGFVCILGKPNVGKSTLLNKIIGERVAIVSPKPQTTRNKILGILNEDDYQIVFIDTPGIHEGQNKLDDFMSKSIKNAKKDADIILLVFDATKRMGEKEFNFLNGFKNSNSKIILVINKIDEVSYEKMYPLLAKLNKIDFFIEVIPISAKTGKNVDVLVDKIKSLLTDSIVYFNKEDYTDKPIRFLVAENIREKALWLLNDEIPHGVAVEILKFEEKENIVNIDADIVCEKKSHKPIIIGKDGSMLKNIGTKSRLNLEKLLNKKVMLKLFVKVRENWRNNENLLTNFGYKDEK